MYTYFQGFGTLKQLNSIRIDIKVKRKREDKNNMQMQTTLKGKHAPTKEKLLDGS